VATGNNQPVLIRTKLASDDEACVAVMERTHAVDGYPRYWPAKPARFLRAQGETDAWVAVLDRGLGAGVDDEPDGRVVGQVALHRAEGEPVLALAQQATGLPAERLAVLARLLVHPDVRGRGVGRALVRTATARAQATGRRAVLDVLQSTTGPARLYESEGWTRLGPTTLDLSGFGYGDVPPLQLWVYLSPDA
jgi:GNAT superfamily N-acetyltransferase